MDLKRMKGGKKDDGKPSRTPSAGRAAPGKSIDARPGSQGAGPRSIQDTQAWKEGSAGLKQGWSNYRVMLATTFQRMPRADQELLITHACVIVTMGVTVLLLMFVYNFLPLYFRVLGLPVLMAASWWGAKKLVSPIIIVRYEEYLNKDGSIP